MTSEDPGRPYLLGLDLGVQSVGWAVIELDGQHRPRGVRRTGVRCFDSGVGSESMIAAGKDESANATRRQARQQRRQSWRRARRRTKLFHVLQAAGLLPADPTVTPQQRHELLLRLDRELAREFVPAGDRVAAHLLPYRLRFLALSRPLPPFAVGRALLHVGQRRGFLSNRKTPAKRDEDQGKIKAAIGDLARQIESTDARTLGGYLSQLDPEEDKQRIRQRFTGRKMYLDEFDRIWSAQAGQCPSMTDDARDRIHAAIFYQRPLKPQKGMVGMCELEPGCRRAPRASLEAQRFRYLQKVNDLEVSTPTGEIWAMNDPSHADLRASLIKLLETNAEVEFKTLRSKLGLKKPKGCETDYRFNLEAGGEKRLKGNATASKLRRVLGDQYGKLSQEQLRGVVDDLIAYEKKDALARRLVARYGVSPQKAEDLADVALEDGYASLSREALVKVLPLMEEGLRFATARDRVYGDRAGSGAQRDRLPPVLEAVPQLRNPVVRRGLTELRKVVNAIIREYGKPDAVRIELARDLKRSRDKREQITAQNRRNENARDDAERQITKQLGIEKPRPGDILKVRLAEECNWECPYTGKSISMESLVGPSPQFDIEHIIPFSQSLDNYFGNKTLCDVKENRDVKQNRTPYQAYSCNEQRWAEILSRVKRFRGPAAHAKLRKFQQKEPDGDFAARLLQDTRYMSRLAMEYVGLLYGGAIDPAGRRRVQASAGGITAYLRGEWGLNAILADGGDEKNRNDHRHHAVDAVCVALTDAGTVKQLSDSAARAELQGNRRFTPIEKPWPTFPEDVRASVDAINVSYRVSRRASGSLHKDSFYSKPHPAVAENGKEIPYRHIRKRLKMITSAEEVEAIVDDRVRKCVKAHLERFGGDLKRAFGDEQNHPHFKTSYGRIIPIHKARIRKNEATIDIGAAEEQRHVSPGLNHHMEIVAALDDRGQEIEWEFRMVSLYDAAQRVRARKRVVQREHERDKKFKFSIAKNEYLMMEFEPGRAALYRVDSISENDIEFHLHYDARLTTVKGRKRVRIRSPRALQRVKARKVAVDPLGNILPAND